jgi:hypothetical protein
MFSRVIWNYSSTCSFITHHRMMLLTVNLDHVWKPLLSPERAVTMDVYSTSVILSSSLIEQINCQCSIYFSVFLKSCTGHLTSIVMYMFIVYLSGVLTTKNIFLGSHLGSALFTNLCLLYCHFQY